VSKKRTSRKKKLGAWSIVAVLLIALFILFTEGPGRKLLTRWGVPVPWKPVFVSVEYDGDGSAYVYGGIPKGPDHLLLLENKDSHLFANPASCCKNSSYRVFGDHGPEPRFRMGFKRSLVSDAACSPMQGFGGPGLSDIKDPP